MEEPKHLLIVYLSDGRVLQGKYTWLGAMARLGFAKTLPAFKDFAIKTA